MHTRLLVDAATAAMYIEPMTARHVGPWYHETCFSAATLRETAKAVAETLARLKSYFPELQAVAGSGHSGSVLVGALSATTDFNPILVRKEGEIQVAGGGQVSGMLGEFDYVIVDDLVSSGSTVRRIVSKIKETAKKAGVTEPRCVAIVTYNGTNKEVDAGWDILPAIDVRQHDFFGEGSCFNWLNMCKRMVPAKRPKPTVDENGIHSSAETLASRLPQRQKPTTLSECVDRKNKTGVTKPANSLGY